MRNKGTTELFPTYSDGKNFASQEHKLEKLKIWCVTHTRMKKVNPIVIVIWDKFNANNTMEQIRPSIS